MSLRLYVTDYNLPDEHMNLNVTDEQFCAYVVSNQSTHINVQYYLTYMYQLMVLWFAMQKFRESANTDMHRSTTIQVNRFLP